MPATAHYVSQDWYKSPQGQEILSSLMYRNKPKRKPFGLLERPILSSQWNLDEFEYKIFISGRTGVGKTSTAAKLAAQSVPTAHSETPGIQTSTVYWPAYITDINKVVMFKLQLWDSGENALKKFDHVLPACKDHADAVVFVFSFADRASFDDVPQQMSRILGPHDQNLAKFILATKLDQNAMGEITQRDIKDFENQWKLPVLTIQNLMPQSDSISDVEELSGLLNYICDELWKRDQILAGKVASEQQPSVGYC